MNILEAASDPNLFGKHFKDRETWAAWFAFLRVLFGLDQQADDRGLIHKAVGAPNLHGHAFSEAWLICGRRAGKSFVLALIAVYLACFRDWRPHLQPGERGTILILACDVKQARVIFRYVAGLIESCKLLAPKLLRKTATEIELDNAIVIEVRPASFRAVRGYTIVAALCDEIAFWRSDDSANPDFEVLNALRPAMATVPGSMLLCASSPYAKRGALWQAYRKHYGKDSDVLVWKADTRTMNPTVPQSLIDKAYADDAEAARAEYGAEFRSDLSTFLPIEAIEACVQPDRRELPPLKDTRYFAFVDPSGGRSDSMTLAIAHRKQDMAVLDAVREVPAPFNPDAVTAEFAALLKTYRIATVEGDRYGGEWPRERFAEYGIRYTVADKTRSELYLEVLPVINARRVELLDHDKLTKQLAALERRTHRSGKDSIDHAPGAHDDVANAVAGVVARIMAKRKGQGPRLDRLTPDPRPGHVVTHAGDLFSETL